MRGSGKVGTGSIQVKGSHEYCATWPKPTASFISVRSGTRTVRFYTRMGISHCPFPPRSPIPPPLMVPKVMTAGMKGKSVLQCAN